MSIKLRKSYATLDEVPETFRPLYVESDGKVTFDGEIEGLVPVKKVDEFRDTNTRLMAEKEELEKKFEGVDLDKYKDLLGKEADLTDGKLVKKGTAELEAVLKPRIDEALKAPLEQNRKLSGDLAVTRDKLERAVIANGVVQAALPLGLEEGAAQDLIERARKIFKLNEEGESVAYMPDGKTIRYHLGTEPYTFDIFAKELASDPTGKHLFKDNTGGGGEQQRRTGGGGDNVNYWDKAGGTWNKTQQGLLMNKDFKRAQRDAAKFGFTIQPLLGA